MGQTFSKRLDIDIKRGEFKSFELVVEESNFSFSDWSAKVQVKNNYGDTAAVIELNSGADITLSGDTATIKFPSSKTDIAEGKYWWDIMFTDPDGDKHYPKEGQFTVKRRVTS